MTMKEILRTKAKEVSSWYTRVYNEPIDADEVGRYARYFEAWLNYYQGNISMTELLEICDI